MISCFTNVLEYFQLVLTSRLKLNITKVGTDLDKPEQKFTSIMKEQNLTFRVAKHHWGSTKLAFIWLDLVTKQLI